MCDSHHDELRASILEGRLEPGERLPSENHLAERYGTSRPTVRRVDTDSADEPPEDAEAA